LQRFQAAFWDKQLKQPAKRSGVAKLKPCRTVFNPHCIQPLSPIQKSHSSTRLICWDLSRLSVFRLPEMVYHRGLIFSQILQTFF
jgi:hypothetical protein